MNNPYYFSGVDDPYLEIWALVDNSDNILLLDQNIFLLKILDSIPFTNLTRIHRLSKCSNFNVFKRHMNNSNCTKFAAYGDTIAKANRDTTEIQAKLFETRYKISKMLEESVSSDFYQSVFTTSMMMFMFGNDEATKNISFDEITRFSKEVEHLNNLISELYEH